MNEIDCMHWFSEPYTMQFYRAVEILDHEQITEHTEMFGGEAKRLILIPDTKSVHVLVIGDWRIQHFDMYHLQELYFLGDISWDNEVVIYERNAAWEDVFVLSQTRSFGLYTLSEMTHHLPIDVIMLNQLCMEIHWRQE